MKLLAHHGRNNLENKSYWANDKAIGTDGSCFL